MAGKNDPIAAQLIILRRNQILDAATTVFASKGFHRATIKDIAQTAGIADGTIYTYFKSKPDLLLGILDRMNESERRTEDLSSLTGQDYRSFFVAYMRHRIKVTWPNAEMLRAVLPELLVNAELRTQYYQQVVEPTIKVAEPVFEMLMEQGKIRRMDVALGVRAVAGMVLGTLIMQLLGDKEIAASWEELPEVFATLLLDGLIMPQPE